jgi:hypothetical protein
MNTVDSLWIAYALIIYLYLRFMSTSSPYIPPRTGPAIAGWTCCFALADTSICINLSKAPGWLPLTSGPKHRDPLDTSLKHWICMANLYQSLPKLIHPFQMKRYNLHIKRDKSKRKSQPRNS